MLGLHTRQNIFFKYFFYIAHTKTGHKINYRVTYVCQTRLSKMTFFEEYVSVKIPI